MAKRNNVSVKLHKDYFEKIFEPGRRSLERKFGVSFSQTKYTEYLVKKQLQVPRMKQSKKYFPKRFTI
jgi:hypothetical protein